METEVLERKIKPSHTPHQAVFYKDDKHDYFYIHDGEFREKLKSGRDRHRLTLQGKYSGELIMDTGPLTDLEVRNIEIKYLK